MNGPKNIPIATYLGLFFQVPRRPVHRCRRVTSPSSSWARLGWLVGGQLGCGKIVVVVLVLPLLLLLLVVVVAVWGWFWCVVNLNFLLVTKKEKK